MMLYLPRGVSAWIAQRALEAEQDQGSFMIGIVTKYAWDHGFECNHPTYAQKLHKGAKPSLGAKPFFKCMVCGTVYQKKASEV
jgi:hypothetical protein